MNVKNLLLNLFAIILSICLIILLFLATNQNALAKVQHTITTFSNINSVSLIEDITPFKERTAQASETKSGNGHNLKQHSSSEMKHDRFKYSTHECKVIAENFASHQGNQPNYVSQISETHENITFKMNNNKQQSININKKGQADLENNK